MAHIDLQKLTTSGPLSNGYAAINLGDVETPAPPYATVYIDKDYTIPYEREDGKLYSTNGVQLDMAGEAVKKGGQRTNIYIGNDYSLQLFDSSAGKFWPSALRVTVGGSGSPSMITSFEMVGNQAGQNPAPVITSADNGKLFCLYNVGFGAYTATVSADLPVEFYCFLGAPYGGANYFNVVGDAGMELMGAGTVIGNGDKKTLYVYEAGKAVLY